jgi:hypothetical protein
MGSVRYPGRPIGARGEPPAARARLRLPRVPAGGGGGRCRASWGGRKKGGADGRREVGGVPRGVRVGPARLREGGRFVDYSAGKKRRRRSEVRRRWRAERWQRGSATAASLVVLA